MTAFARRQSLLEMLQNQPSLRVAELAEALQVSQGTIRNDLNVLETQGRLTRVFGGATLNEPTQFQNNSFLRRFQENKVGKQTIAHEAAGLVANGDSILLDASTTVYYLARALSKREQLRVVTNGFEVARELAHNTSNTVILIGGVVNNDSSSVTGLFSEQILSELHFAKAFVSCTGFSLERGLSEIHLGEAQIKRKAIQSSHQVIALVDSSKFGREDLTSFARLDQITHLITDSGLAPEWIERLEQAGVHFTLCKVEAMAVNE